MATVGSPLREVAANTAAPSPTRKHARSDGAPANGGGGVDKDARISELEAEVERLKKRLKTAEQRGAGGGGASGAAVTTGKDPEVEADELRKMLARALLGGMAYSRGMKGKNKRLAAESFASVAAVEALLRVDDLKVVGSGASKGATIKADITDFQRAVLGKDLSKPLRFGYLNVNKLTFAYSKNTGMLKISGTYCL